MINRDYDDVRRFADAASAGLRKALGVGARAPVLAVFAGKEYRHANLVSLLAALETTYVVRDLDHESEPLKNEPSSRCKCEKICPSASPRPID